MEERPALRQLPAEQADQHHDRGLHTTDEPQHGQLGAQVGGGGQPGGTLAAIDRAFLDQFPHRVERPGETGADNQNQQQRRGGVVGGWRRGGRRVLGRRRVWGRVRGGGRGLGRRRRRGGRRRGRG